MLAGTRNTEADSTAPYSRDRLTLFALLILAGISIALSILVAGPFIPGLTWALAFAVVAYPLHHWICGRVRRRELAAGISVLVVALALVLPAVIVGWSLASEAASAAAEVQQRLKSGELENELEQSPRLSGAWYWIESNVDLKRAATKIADSLQQRATVWLSNGAWSAIQIVIALFALFFFFRDRREVLEALRSYLPLSDSETDYLFTKVRGVVHATIYGTVLVAAIQGAMGGFMFWILGLPGAFLWGFVMAALSMIPILGAPVVWVPAAIFLAAQGEWGKMALLVTWGALAIGLIDNILQPRLIGKEIRFHTLPVFVAIIGGVSIFGAVGLILGPMILAATTAIVDILRWRTSEGRSAEEQT